MKIIESAVIKRNDLLHTLEKPSSLRVHIVVHSPTSRWHGNISENPNFKPAFSFGRPSFA